MLAQHLVDFNTRRNLAVLVQMTDLDHARTGILEDQPQFARTDERHRISHAGI